MKNLIILGSTGSIGLSTLRIVDHLKNDFTVVALAARSNVDEMERQIKKYRPKIAALYDPKQALELKKRVPEVEVLSGMEGLNQVAAFAEGDTVVSAIAGTMGLEPTYHAIKAGKKIALANKEVLISGGSFIMSHAASGQIMTVDSEHSALFQCLVGEKKEEVRRLILTASGGPFRNKSYEELEQVTVKSALAHPTWSMGPKITIDSSTLMNKGLEVIEAYHLFGISKIDVVIHPQSVIHSMVEFRDGSMKAQMSKPDMKLPIQYALTYPERKEGLLEPFDFTKFSKLEFFQPDTVKFKCLRLAFDALEEGGSFPGTLNAANEVLVERFLKEEITWIDIGNKLETLLARHNKCAITDLYAIKAVDENARELAKII